MRHITGSLACPMVRLGVRNIRRGHRVLWILQMNLNRCRLAQDRTMQCVCESSVDIVVISEPHRQLSYWFNDEGRDASIWVILFNGKHAASEILTRSAGIVGVSFIMA